jgi:integrase
MLFVRKGITLSAPEPAELFPDDYLGHVSIETTRQFYAHTDKERIVEALRGST